MSKVGMVEESMDLLKEITEEFFNFDQTIFNVVLDGCSKFSKIAEMQEILNLMDSCGFPLTVVGYNTIIDGLVRAGHTTKAWDVLDSMVKFSILPDHFTISTLCRGIKGPESRKHFDRVIELFYQYREELELRTTVMYNCLLECCVLMRNMSLALSLFEEFKQESGEEKPDLVS
jgi:pentatricopeptide repeat protein